MYIFFVEFCYVYYVRFDVHDRNENEDAHSPRDGKPWSSGTEASSALRRTGK